MKLKLRSYPPPSKRVIRERLIPKLHDKLHDLGGTFRKDALGLFSVMRDEMWFLPAFLEHYRRIGVEQFVILDDASTDGTREYLLSQPDVFVLASEYRFGDILYQDSGFFFAKTKSTKDTKWRAGRLYKELIPQKFFEGRFALYADADEFLFLPPGVASLWDVIDRLTSIKAECVTASLVEFFPNDLIGLEDRTPSKSMETLLKRYPFFEARPILQLRAGEQAIISGPSKSTELFSRYLAKGPKDITSPVLKTPIVHHNADNRRDGSHRATQPPVSNIMLTMAHFVFTGQLKEKVDRAVKWRSHALGGYKYYKYAEILKEMERRGDNFRGPNTVRFESVEQFLDAGLMLW